MLVIGSDLARVPSAWEMSWDSYRHKNSNKKISRLCERSVDQRMGMYL